MNKILISFVALMVFGMASVSHAIYIDAAKMLEVADSSGIVVGPCYVQKVFLSTPTPNTSSHVALYITTNTTPNGGETNTQVSPGLVYTSTNALTGTAFFGAYEAIDYGKPGIFIDKNLLLLNNGTTSGEAYKAFIQYVR